MVDEREADDGVVCRDLIAGRGWASDDGVEWNGGELLGFRWRIGREWR